MQNYFKEIADRSSCALSGVCSTHPSISALHDNLMLQLREISFYIVKLKELGYTNKPTMAQSIEALSLFLVNTSFNQTKYLNLIAKLYSIKMSVKQKYKNCCDEQELPCEIIKSSFEITPQTTIAQLIEYAENNAINKQKAIDKTKQKLYELVSLFSKLASVSVVKIKKYVADFDEYDFEILRFFALTNAYSIRNEKIKRRIIEFSKIALSLREKLIEVLALRYGEKQSAMISESEVKGHALLISGDDLNELEDILKEIEKNNLDINIYTNGPMILAHFYPYFKQNEHLKGHLEDNNIQYLFSTFPGAVLITKHFLQKIDNLYKGTIYSNKTISFSKVIDIENNDYKSLLDKTLEMQGFLADKEGKVLNINYDIKKIDDIIQNFEDDKIVIVAGVMQDDELLSQYKDIKILNLNCPLETDLLFKTVKALRAKNVEITCFFPQCGLESLYSALIMLAQDIKIYVSNYSNILINPHVIEALAENFNVKVI